MEARQADRAVLLAAAAAELLKAHALLAEHAVALGHVDKLLRMLQTNVPPAEGGCFLPLPVRQYVHCQRRMRLPRLIGHLTQQSRRG